MYTMQSLIASCAVKVVLYRAILARAVLVHEQFRTSTLKLVFK